MRHSYRVPLRDVLKVDTLRYTTVLAGSKGLDRVVTRLNVMEVPDIVNWVRPHALLVTSGYPLMSLDVDGDPGHREFVELVRGLDELDVAALGIKVGRFLDEVPAPVLQVADELGFPILGLSAETAFDDLLEEVHIRLTDVQADVLQRTDALHAALEGLVLEGAGLQEIASRIADVLGVGILVTSIDGREKAGALTHDMRVALEEADLFDPTGRFRVERPRLQPMDIGEGQVLVQPVVAGGSDLARLVAYDPHRAISKDDLNALQRASTVAALLITQQQALTAVESRYRGDFLREVLDGRGGDPDHVIEHAKTLDWRLEFPAIVITAELDPPPPDQTRVPARVRRSWQERFFAAWTQVVGSFAPQVPMADFSEAVVTVLAAPEGMRDDPERAAAGLRDLLARIVKSVAGDRGGGRRPFSVGASRLVSHLGELPVAYQQARRATEVGRRFSGGSSTFHFDDLGVHRLIGLIPDRSELAAFAEDVLGELARDTPEAAELRETLRVLLDTNLNVAEASRLQFVHYNTMRYRIGKLEQMLGPFTTDANLRLNLAVALQVREIQR
ncbi:PucR family transcriptional regulator [uncultured Aeromicrobium sp.]|uniref:PucR family transcriptional regulator n=1 Tax=uncultured Aeromicrobium sp. TaxID=337820 RepID=UPI0025EF88BA|nr:PucR family transcriptional regulator [uncultured Aeromicrobium sp.]